MTDDQRKKRMDYLMKRGSKGVEDPVPEILAILRSEGV